MRSPGFLTAQSIVLFASIGLFVVQIGGELSHHRELLVTDHPWYGAFQHFLHRGEYVLEFACLSIGVICLYTYPGIAALRCFRVLRLLWLSDNSMFRYHVTLHTSGVLGKPFVDRCFRVFKFSIRSLSALGNEMFRLTSKTRGGLFLMLILFYMAFVVGITLWIETGDADNDCGKLGQCMYTMLRLTFFDGTGLDYAYSLTQTNHNFLFFIVMAYMCISSFGIINGMIGIFATIFATASEEAFVADWDENDNQFVHPTDTASPTKPAPADSTADAVNQLSATDDVELQGGAPLTSQASGKASDISPSAPVAPTPAFTPARAPATPSFGVFSRNMRANTMNMNASMKPSEEYAIAALQAQVAALHKDIDVLMMAQGESQRQLASVLELLSRQATVGAAQSTLGGV